MKTGKVPFQTWVNRIKDTKTRVRIARYIQKVSEGSKANVKPIGEGVFEITMNFGPGYRCYFTESKGSILILNGGDKSSQKRDIKAAKKYWKTYKHV